MKIDIRRFNLTDVPVAPDAVIAFPGGIAGFENSQRFSLFHEEGKPQVFWLQSLDDPELMLSIIDPQMLDLEYEIELSEAEIAALDLAESDETCIMVVVYRGQSETDANDQNHLSANSQSPLILNLSKRLGVQKRLKDVHPRLVLRGK